MNTIYCKKCGNTKDLVYFSPQERINDNKPHICWECEGNKETKTKNRLNYL